MLVCLHKEKTSKRSWMSRMYLKEMFSETIQEILKAELETELGYPNNGDKPAVSGNRRNGQSSKKSVRSMVNGDVCPT